MNNHFSYGTRATTIEELETVLGKFFDKTKIPLELTFQPHPSDIIISPFSKCGTTWLQQIVHGLRTRGSMEFDEISSVIPWIKAALDLGCDLDSVQVAEPRVFKSHENWHRIPKGARYIVSFRHYHDFTVSLYRFWEGWLFEPGTISLEALTHWLWLCDEAHTQKYWYHLISWWEQRHNDDVLLLSYEDMKANLPDTVQKVARFMGIEPDDSLLDIVIQQSSREFMLAHEHQFGERRTHEIMGKRAGLPPPISTSKVTAGASNRTRYQLSPSLKKELDDIWQEQVQLKFGFKSYEEFRWALRELS